jgi:hypothetical protein
MRRFKLLLPLTVILLALPAISPACQGPTKLTHFAYPYLSVYVPPGWAAAEGPHSLAMHIEGEIALNSWGQADFWAGEVRSGSTLTYSPATIMSRVPDGGAYVALVRVTGPPDASGRLPHEDTHNSLEGLVNAHDWRQDTSSEADVEEFYKWGRNLQLVVGCNIHAADKTLGQLNDLLASWQFDAIPAGDPGWAFSVARKLLPAQVGPAQFNSQTTMQYDQAVARKSEVDVRADRTVHFRFTYYWNVPPSPADMNNPSTAYHWWEIDVPPTGKAVLTGQGGAPLPQ